MLNRVLISLLALSILALAPLSANASIGMAIEGVDRLQADEVHMTMSHAHHESSDQIADRASQDSVSHDHDSSDCEEHCSSCSNHCSSLGMVASSQYLVWPEQALTVAFTGVVCDRLEHLFRPPIFS